MTVYLLFLAVNIMSQGITKHNFLRFKLPTDPSRINNWNNQIVYGVWFKRREFYCTYTSAAIFIEHS